MQAITFLREAEKLQNPILGFNDIVRIIGKSPEYARVFIHRLKKKNFIAGIERGKYALAPDPFETGSNLIFPSYISFMGAYAVYHLTTQLPSIIQVISTKSKAPITLENMKIVFIKFKKERMFGYKKERFRNKYIFIAEPEKAIVDSLYLPEYCPISESSEALKSQELSHEKLAEYALQMDSVVTVKRLGYLLEQNGVDIYSKVKHKLNKRYDLLNPLLKRSKINSSRWKLNINEAV